MEPAKMATSFAAYASQFISGQQGREQSMASSSAQPMFFSFTTDNSGGEGSRGVRGLTTTADLNDIDDPHLRQSGNVLEEEEEDPYLRLDEEAGQIYNGSRYTQRDTRPLLASERPESPPGWLANQNRMSPSRYSRSSSPTSSDSNDSGPPPELMYGHRPKSNQAPPPQTNREPVSLSLTESLLPRDGTTRPLDVFSLPDPRHSHRHRRKYNDHMWTAAWCAGISVCVFFAVLLPFITSKSSPARQLPYITLLHTVPLITILTFVSAAVAYAHVFLLQIFVKPVMIATSVFVPATLFISALWAFIGSFMWERGVEPTWGETVGLRLFSLIPLALSLLTARRLLHLPRQIHTTSATLTLVTELLIANPLLLALSPAILLAMLLASIPFVTVIFRLLLIGYWQTIDKTTANSRLEWHVHGWANWAIVATGAVWLWTWGVARGTLRMTCASVIGAWYFANPDALPPPPMSTHTIHAALTRSSGPSLGTTVLSALILTIVRILSLLTIFLQRLPVYIPSLAQVAIAVRGIKFLVGYLDGVTTALSKYALVYTGLTGDPFIPSAKRAKALTAKVEGRGHPSRSVEPPQTLLTIAPLTLSFPFALSTYLFTAHTLGAPNEALGAALLAGIVTALVGLFCVGLIKDTADTLYLCYCIDKDLGERKREVVFNAFEYQPQRHVQPPTSPDSPIAPSTRGRQRGAQQVLLGPLSVTPSPPPPRKAPLPLHSPPIRTPPAQRPPPALATTPPRAQSQRPAEEEDVNPFEHTPSLSFLQERPQEVRAKSPTPATSASSSRIAQSRVIEDSDSDDDEDGSQFFPGSGLFGALA